MSQTFPLKDVMTEEEFDRLWSLSDEESGLDPLKVDAHVAGTPFSNQQRRGDQYNRNCDEATSAKMILHDVCSDARETHRSSYASGHGLASAAAFQKLAEDFNEWAGGKSTPGHNRSGMMPLLARMMAAQINTNPHVISDRNAHLLVPGIFTRAEIIEALDPDTYSTRVEHFKRMQRNEASLRVLAEAAFGIDMTGKGRLKKHERMENIDRVVLESAIRIAGSFRHPVHDSSLVRVFVNAAAAHCPELFDERNVRDAMSQAYHNLDEINREIAPARAALANWMAMTQG